jgi:hypothetical protein
VIARPASPPGKQQRTDLAYRGIGTLYTEMVPEPATAITSAAKAVRI